MRELHEFKEELKKHDISKLDIGISHSLLYKIRHGKQMNLTLKNYKILVKFLFNE